ncbi:DUF4142 domain-containing protein [Catellatospora tritici]|uniref:DUF4142 domain-containing protein n=1 Tax=Catellatospora tritici TaxID=2851566 RepID=UPI001C2CD1C4|nr:DUF4142 domain-containing protein [Catellatospora tritici]MBV1854839.1 DUF4142 domain-containing protein [Catellatospora tritici]
MNPIRGLFIVVAAAVAVATATPAAAQAQPSAYDQSYVISAHQAYLAGIAAADLAAQRGTASQVKDLGTRFHDEYTKLDADLVPLAERLGVKLPGEVTENQQAVTDQLKQATAGQPFDWLWLRTQRAATGNSLDNISHERNYGTDLAIKAHAEQALNTIRDQYVAIDEAGAQLGTWPGW